MVVEGIKRKIDNARTKQLIYSIFYLCVGFLLSLGAVYGGARPFGIAIVSVSRKRRYIFSAVGAALGYIIGGLTIDSARYLSAVVIACVGALAGDVFKLNHTPVFAMVVALLSDLFTGLVLNIQSGAIRDDYFILFCESVLTLGASYFYYKALNANYKRLRFRALPVSDMICVVVSISTVLLSVASLRFGVICPMQIVASALVLLCVRFAGERWSVLLAICLGFVMSIGENSSLFAVGGMAFSTVVACLFTSLSSFGIAVGYLCSVAFFALAGQDVGFFVDNALGALLFVLMPTPICDKISDFFDSGKDIAPDGTLRQNLVLKLRFASSAMATISENVEQVSEKINDITRRENEMNKDTLTEEEYIRREIILEKTNQIRMVASDQFFSISDMLDDLALEFDEAEIFDSNASSKIRRLLGDYDIYPINISAIEDKFGRMRVEILAEGGCDSLDDPSLCNEIGRICSRYFEKGRITTFKNETMLSFFERPSYKLSIGFSQHSAEGKLCGDTVKIINDNKGHSILIISDGMGKGSRAALDGAMGAGLLSRLINAGFGFDSALKVVNSALLVKSNDESLATLDIANIDLFTGKCEMLKAGAPAGYIIKNGSITKCELSSMPAGILRGIEFARRTAVLGVDDVIVLMSDGITDLGEEWLKNIVLEAYYMDCQQAADYILASALEYADGQKIDDMSVICARLERN